jgi:Peptidase family M23
MRLLPAFRVTCLTALAVASLPASARAQAVLPPPLELRVPKPPTVATADGKSFLVYELHVTNFSRDVMALKQVEVAAGEGASRRVLVDVADSTLARSIARPGVTIPIADGPKIAGGMRAVVFMWVPVDHAKPPTSIRNRVTVEQQSGDSTRRQELDGPPVPVAPEFAPIGPPLRGGPWLSANGPEPLSGHRRALVPTGGAPTIAQRFAIDWVLVDSTYRTFNGDQLRNESYYAYGNDALAVANGVVVVTRDGIPQNIPGATSRAVPITLETVGGNHVIIDIGTGRYAFYAHLQPGSLRVKVGDHVTRGQVIGLVGNSGNSTEPHLHFHVSDSPSPLGSEGVPNAYDSFQVVGRCRSLAGGCERTPAVTHKGEVVTANLLIEFPK